jgi:O-antigen ligase
MARMLAWFGIASATVYLVFVGGGWPGIYDFRLRALTVAIAGMTLAIWGVVALRRPEWRPRTILFPAIAACLLSLTISTIFSRNVRVSAEYLAYGVILASLYLLLVRIMASPFLRVRLITLSGVLFVALAIEFVVVVLFLWSQWWAELGGLALPPLRPNFVGLNFGNPSAVLTVVVLLAVPAAATWGRTAPRALVAIIGIGLTVGLVALLSGSRAGWLALAASAVAGGLVWILDRGHRTLLRSAFQGLGPRSARGRSVWRGGLTLIGVAFLAAVASALPAVGRRLGEGGEDLRATYAAIALRLFGQSPIVGTGPGTWVIERIATTQANETDYYIPHAHDVPLQTLAELGLFGAAAGAILLVSLSLLIWGAIRSPDESRRRWGWVTGLGLVYFGLHNLLDFYANLPAALFAAAIPIAYLDATRLPREAAQAPARLRLPTKLRAAGQVLAILVVAIAVIGTLATEFPASQEAQAVARANAGDWAGAAAPARSAAADSSIASYLLTAGLTAARTGDDLAAAAFFRSVATTDDLPEAWLNLAAEQVRLNDAAGARTSLQAALRLGIQRPAIAMAAGELALELGESDLATATFTSALIEVPTLAGDPWWTSRLGAEVYATILNRAMQLTAPETRWELALMSGDSTRASELAAQASVGPDLALAIVAAWNRIPGADDRVFSVCRAQPLNTELLAWCAMLASRQGDEATARRYRALADTVVVGSSLPSYQLRVDPSGVGTAGGTATFWGLYTYRRDTPADLLVPSLLHLKLQ